MAQCNLIPSLISIGALYTLLLVSAQHLASASTVDVANLGREIAQQDAPYLIVSAETNSLRSGLFVNSSNHVINIRGGKLATQIFCALWNVSTNKVTYFWPTDPNCRIEVTLSDENGSQVPRTKEAELIGKPLPPLLPNTPPRHRICYGAFIPATTDVLYTWQELDVRNLPNWFRLQKPGTYTLTFTQRIYRTQRGPRGPVLQPIRFEPVSVRVVVADP